MLQNLLKRRKATSEQAIVQEAFSSLSLDGSALTLSSLIEKVSTLRGRPIVVESAEGLRDTETCGLWLSTEHTEFVFHAPTDSDLHRQQCILHELAHMILRHDETVVSAGYAKTLFPDLAGEKVRSALARSEFAKRHEIIAEQLADLLASAISDAPQEPANFEKVFG